MKAMQEKVREERLQAIQEREAKEQADARASITP